MYRDTLEPPHSLCLNRAYLHASGEILSDLACCLSRSINMELYPGIRQISHLLAIDYALAVNTLKERLTFSDISL